MNHEPRTTMLLLVAIAGCVLADMKLGEGAETSDTGSQDSSDSGATVTVTSEANTDSATGPIDPLLPGIGAPCEHWEPGDVPESKLLTYPHDGCAGEMCLYADVAEAPKDPCASDADCNAANPAVDRFVCNDEAACELSPVYFAQRSMCSAFCSVDADCATDETTTCQTGFRCAPITSLGEACCRPICVCADDLDEADAVELTQACSDGTQPGCCDQLPGNGLCPD